MKFNKVVTFLVLSFFFVNFIGCAGLVKYPDTPKGQALFYTASLHKLVIQYNAEAAIATNPTYKNILQKRRIALASSFVAIRGISTAVSLGQPITVGMIDAANIALGQVKEYLLTRQGVGPSGEEIRALLEKAHITTGTSAQGIETALIALIELIQAMYPLWSQLNQQATMTPEQVEAQFQIEHSWIITFTDADLVVVE